MSVDRVRRSVIVIVIVIVIVCASAMAACSTTSEPTITQPSISASSVITPSSLIDSAASSDVIAPGTTTAPSTMTAPVTVSPTSASAPPAVLPGPISAESIVATLTASLTVLHSDAATVDERERAGQMMQLALRAMSKNSAWDDQVLASLPADDHAVIGPIIAARQVATKRAAELGPRPPSPTLPAWTIADPESAADLVSYYREAEQLTGIGWNYLAAINLQETRMGRIRGPSSAGAQGPMQFLPTTWAECCVGDIHDPHDAIIGAARYLAASGGPADMGKALNQYNPSKPYVAAVTAYAEHLAIHPEAYIGYHAWQVFVGSAAGDVRLPKGYAASTPLDAADYLASHPGDAAGP